MWEKLRVALLGAGAMILVGVGIPGLALLVMATLMGDELPGWDYWTGDFAQGIAFLVLVFVGVFLLAQSGEKS